MGNKQHGRRRAGGRRLASWLAVVVAAISLSGCYKATFINDSVRPAEVQDEWTDFFLFGLVGHEQVDVKRFCAGEVARVRTGGNFGTGIVSVLTIGIYTPRKVYVWCSADGQHARVVGVSEVTQ